MSDHHADTRAKGGWDRGTWALLAICGVGWFLRVFNITGPSLWLDEIMTVGRVAGSAAETLQHVYISPHPPLYYLLLNFWLALVPLSEFFLRLPSALFSALTVPVVYWIARQLFDRRTGLIAALLLSLSPYQISYAQEAKSYALLWFLLAVSFGCFFRFQRDGSGRALRWYVVSSVASIYTLYSGFLFIAVQNALFFLFYRGAREKRWFRAQLLIAASFIPWLPFFLYNAFHRSGIEWISPVTDHGKMLLDTLELISGLSIRVFRNPAEFWLLLLLLSAGVFSVHRAAGRGWSVSGPRDNERVLLVWLGLPLCALFILDLFGWHLFVVRYVGFVSVPLVILVAHALARDRHWLRRVALGLLVLSTVLLHLVPFYRWSMKVNQEDWRSLGRKVQETVTSEDLLWATSFTDTEMYFFSRGFRIYLPGKEISTVSPRYSIPVPDKPYRNIYLFYLYYRPAVDTLPGGYALKEESVVRVIDRNYPRKPADAWKCGVLRFQRQ